MSASRLVGLSWFEELLPPAAFVIALAPLAIDEFDMTMPSITNNG